jgi:predicted DNA-binding antitoxin AbrB/MazE fold protein
MCRFADLNRALVHAKGKKRATSRSRTESSGISSDAAVCVRGEPIVVFGRDIVMTQITEAVYTQGVLKPTGELSLRERQRVRLIVEPIDDVTGDREAAVARLRAGIASMQFFSNGRLPTREELHDRS